MKKISSKLLVILTLLTIPVLSSCDNKPVKEDKMFLENYGNLISLKKLKQSEDIFYDAREFGEFEGIKHQELYFNNVLNNSREGVAVLKDDAKFLYYNKEKMRFLNSTDGYMFDIQTKTTFNVDFSLSKYRSKIYNEEMTLTITKEEQNPYKSWSTYRDDWIIKYLESKQFLEANNLEYTEDVIFENSDILKNHFVSIYSIKINNPGAIRKNYYNIGIVRNKNDLQGKKFYLFVMKSTSNKSEVFKNMISSFKTIYQAGVYKDQYKDMPLKANPIWNEKTKKYFDKLVNQERTDWGIYTYGISESANYETSLVSTQKELEDAMDYNFEILPTYMHISRNNSQTFFPLQQANKHAGGDGFNGKKVLQYSYQFTSTNNGVSANNKQEAYTPMFDILRGKDDNYDYFDIKDRTHNTLEELAKTIKQYDGPVLFRLNNEMNSDWVSYCGLMTLLDPDIFQATWRYLYDLFDSYGVDNCIWIFNPVEKSCPYSNWGEDMCYFPGVDYVQALGLTYYESNNNGRVNINTFREDYTLLYNKFKNSWLNYPWIISEFACGAGGSTTGKRFRNQDSQAQYVKGMFADFNDRKNHPYLQNIKGAVWFSTNDFANGGVSNQYELVVDKLPKTIAEFKEGLKYNK